MCIVALAWQMYEQAPLLLISNRDEFYERASMPLGYQADLAIYAGRDLQQGGTWLGMTPTGRWAVITNYRDGADRRVFDTSRGHLVTQFLQSTLSPIDFAHQLQRHQDDYAGFNLIVGDTKQAVYLSNKGHAPVVLGLGVYVMSNGLMSDDWAKTCHLKSRFVRQLLPLFDGANLGQDMINKGFELLEDTRTQDDLPDTGISHELERLLSSVFIKSPNYGTVSSNVLMMTAKRVLWHEKTQAGKHQGSISSMDFVLKTEI